MKVEERVQAWTDEELSVLLSDYEVKEPKLASQCDKVICKMCVNPQCTNNALMCNELDCEKCGIKAHTRCLHISLRGITEMLGDRVIQQKNFLSDMFKI
jgi:hypothetical protein